MTSKNHYPEPRRYQISSWGFALFPVFGVSWVLELANLRLQLSFEGINDATTLTMACFLVTNVAIIRTVRLEK